jgi:hypothetical protein
VTQRASTSEADDVKSVGSAAQVFMTPAQMGLATSVTHGTTIHSGNIITNGYKAFAFGITLSDAGNASIQRYLDEACTIKQGAALTASLTAATPAVVNATDGVPFAGIVVSVQDTAGSGSGTITACGLLLQAS